MELLQKIKNPKDLKKLNVDDLPKLAAEIRGVIVENISRNGGHLASSLGATDFIIALHYVFEAPRDKIVFDTGHQTYAHKILTGRLDKFPTIRKKGGLSGFPKRHESKYDVFGVGHASTALSAACGMAKARDLKGEDFHVVPVVSDGGLTGGMAWEAMQNIGHFSTRMLIVLNDNQMFISKREGMIGNILNKILAPGTIKNTEEKLELFLKRFKGWGENALKMAKKTKSLFLPGGVFEYMGLSYFGPVDGHNIPEMIKVLRTLKDINKPVLLHLITKKGKGYEPAEMEPTEFHGAGSFNVQTGKQNKSKKTSFTKVFSNAMLDFAEKDKKIVAITAAMPEGTGLDAFRDRYPERYFDVGIAEEHAVTFAGGLACEGYRPVVAIYSTFMQRSFDQIMHDISLQNLPVTFAMDRAGVVGEDGPTHHGLYDLSFLRILPNMTIMAPSDENELIGALKTAIYLGSPAAVRYPRGEGVGVELNMAPEVWEIGKGKKIRFGKDANILAVGNRVRPAISAAEILKSKGYDVGVADMRFIKPLDGELVLDAFEKSQRIVTVEDNAVCGGFGSGVLEFLSSRGIKADVLTLGIGDYYVEHGKPQELYELIGISAEKICEKILNWSARLNALEDGR